MGFLSGEDVMLNIILSIVNVIVAASLVVVTIIYTRATKRIARLEEERKSWEVEPKLILNFKRHDTGHHIAMSNIGRGVATIVHLKWCYNDKELSNDEHLTSPIIGVGQEFVWRNLGIGKNLEELKKWSFQVNYTDMHGSMYYTSFVNGKVDTGKAT